MVDEARERELDLNEKKIKKKVLMRCIPTRQLILKVKELHINQYLFIIAPRLKCDEFEDSFLTISYHPHLSYTIPSPFPTMNMSKW